MPNQNMISSIFILMMTAVLILLGSQKAAHAEDAPLFLRAVDYKTIENTPDCDVKPYYKERLYPRCTDPEKLLNAAKTFAVKNNVPLVILWGFDECPACEDQDRRLFNPDFLPRNKAISAALTASQKAEFSTYTKGSNQLALVRLNSGTSLKHVQAFADEIGANSVAAALGWKKVWSPMFMVMNPETNKLASNTWFSSYEYCSLGEELALGLEMVGIIKANPNEQKACFVPGDFGDEDVENWKTACTQGNFVECFWAGKAIEITSQDMEEEDPVQTKAARASSRKLFDRGCENGIITACRSLADTLPKNGKEYSQAAINLYRKACDQKDMSACTRLALAYKYGYGNLDEDRPKAVELYQMACETHLPFGCAQVGEMAFYRDPGTKPYRKNAKALLAFGCRNNYEWACDETFK